VRVQGICPDDTVHDASQLPIVLAPIQDAMPGQAELIPVRGSFMVGLQLDEQYPPGHAIPPAVMMHAAVVPAQSAERVHGSPVAPAPAAASGRLGSTTTAR
jgi:hypothetical protein